MKLFLSWSGPISHKIATVLRDWVPLVLQSVEPYVSSEDIDKGTRWSSDIAKELEESRYGIICVTHENLKAPWINFEAGALSKTIEKANVAPLLFNIKKSEVEGPLLQFQLTIYEKEDIKKLINSINNASDGIILDKPKIDRIFDQWWPNLEESLEAILKECKASEKVVEAVENVSVKQSKTNNGNEKILEELLELARLQVKILKSPEELLPPGYLSFAIKDTSLSRSLRDAESLSRPLRDVERMYKSLRSLARQTTVGGKEETDQELLREMRELIMRMGDPLEYLVRRSYKSDIDFN